MSSTEQAARVGWQTYRFDQIAENINVRVDNPSEAGVDVYVGLEHLDPAALRIRRWGTPDEVEATKLRFWPGDIIFGRRRFYQRKLAVAEFEGICSAHAMVLRAREDVVVPEFLPFFMQSDAFYERAMAISVGSLSPTINWKALARQEFALPPKDEQRRIAEILWAVEAAIGNWSQVGNALDSALHKFLFDTFTENDWPHVRLGDLVVESAYGPRFSSKYYSEDSGIGCIRTTDLLDDGTIIYSTVPKAALNPAEYSRHLLQDGDFMISRSGTCGIGCVYEDQGEPMLPGAFLIRLRLTNKLNPYFLREYVNSPMGKHRISKLARGAVQKNINGSQLLEELVPVPSLSEQKSLLGVAAVFRRRQVYLQYHLSHLRALKQKLLNDALSTKVLTQHV